MHNLIERGQSGANQLDQRQNLIRKGAKEQFDCGRQIDR